MTHSNGKPKNKPRRSYSKEFKQEAVQMLVDGYSVSSVVERLGITRSNILYRWKKELTELAGPEVSQRDERIVELEQELRRVERERDILKKALAILSQNAPPMSTH
jgi:transposase